jgi:hypothetical protein
VVILTGHRQDQRCDTWEGTAVCRDPGRQSVHDQGVLREHALVLVHSLVSRLPISLPDNADHIQVCEVLVSRTLLPAYDWLEAVHAALVVRDGFLCRCEFR